MASKRLLLLSSSIVFGSGYLDYAETEIRDFLGKRDRILFLPFALHDHDAFAARIRERFNRLGYELDSLHCSPNMKQSVGSAAAIFIGGGNTFRLLKALYHFDLLSCIRQRVEEGALYIGSSAGSNVAGLTIRTTNDMPIVEPPSFDALGLVAFQINPHYLDPDPGSQHMGETREERLLQFLEENQTPVVALREGAMLRIEGKSCQVKGIAGARLFRRGEPPKEIASGSELDLG